MNHLPQYSEALRLEQLLGDPELASNCLSFANAMRLDEQDAFPEAEVSFLLGHGLPEAYVPAHLGGTFTSSETFLALGRVLARRNMTLAVSYSTMLWSMLGWIGGSSSQQHKIAHWVMKQGLFPCLAYSEANHGADLTANELTATKTPQGDYILNGEKWPINRATRSGFLVLLARTNDSLNLRNHSLFIINKNDLESRHYYHLPRVKTHGLHGCDISGIGFRNCLIPASSLIGEEGHGLELALKGFQITRSFCSALSLGVGDSALRLVADFAAHRKLYGRTVAALPHARDIMANAYVSQLNAEVVSLLAARGLHFFPAQFSTWSSIAKVQTTHLIDHACQQLASVLGARYYMREQHAEGMFQKILRDGSIVSVFDGSTPICLDSLATLLPSLAKMRRADVPAADTAALFDLRAEVPPLNFAQLTLFGRGRDAVIESLPGLLQKLEQLPADHSLSADHLSNLRCQARALQQSVARLDEDILAEPMVRGASNSPRQFALAERYIALHSAVAALGLWLHNLDHMGVFFKQAVWLHAILLRQGEYQFRSGQLPADLLDHLYPQLEHQLNQGKMFSLIDWPVAAKGLPQTPPESQSHHHKEISYERHYA
ncbi:acyl-CoA dehydrogenase [Cellvibrio sp. OA-2007]|uniref:acyl-CoA dehydrogenase n=1 Tax=Cellvibrio sp. OA-2007 TaxID=529823 RepID=UPI0007816408|nr:acyl-CoA dehydrogenase [Cellvibrio sp. OA-2007]